MSSRDTCDCLSQRAAPFRVTAPTCACRCDRQNGVRRLVVHSYGGLLARAARSGLSLLRLADSD
jgi:hypothetical protein